MVALNKRGDMMYQRFMQLLQKKGVTPYRVSKDTGISQTTLSDWKTGRATPKADKLMILAKYFDVSIEFFLKSEENNK